MKTIKKVWMQGGSLIITVDKSLAKVLDIEKGDIVEVDIEKIKEVEKDKKG